MRCLLDLPVVCAMVEGDGFFDAVDWESAIKRKEEELRSCKRELDRERALCERQRAEIHILEKPLKKSEIEETRKDRDIERLHRRTVEMEEDIESGRKYAKRVERILNEKDREIGQLLGDKSRLAWG